MIQFGNYQIRFYYFPRENKKNTRCLIEEFKKKFIILGKETTHIVGTGDALCSVNDHFCRDRGRRISMLRAMKAAGFTKDERKQVWEIYRITKTGGRW